MPKELVGGNGSDRNWKGISIAFLVIVAVGGLIVSSAILVWPVDQEKRLKGKRLKFRDIFDDNFKPKLFQATWTTDDEYIFHDPNGAVVKYNIALGEEYQIMDNTTFRRLSVDPHNFQVSPDQKYILLSYDVESVYRHTKLAKYAVYVRDIRKTIYLEGPQRGKRSAKKRRRRFAVPPSPPAPPAPPTEDTPTHDFSKLQYASWGPGAGSSLLFVFENDIYFMQTPTSLPRPITRDGMADVIYNGIPDWVYEEEVLASDNAIWWSPDQRFLCYFKFDDSKVPLYTFPSYGGEGPYTEQKSIHYPKPGATNPTVAVIIHDLHTSKDITLQPPKSLAKSEYYVTTVVWRDVGHVTIAWLNRPQNVSLITICNVNNGGICYESAETVAHGIQQGWVDATHPVFAASGDAYFLILPIEDGVRGAFKQVVMVNASTLDHRGQQYILTHQPWDVTELSAYDDAKGILYFMGTGGNPLKRHLYRIFIAKSRSSLIKPDCITCDLEDGCQFYSVMFSPRAKNYVLTCHGPDLPRVTLGTTDTDGNHNASAMVLEDNYALWLLLNGTALPRIEYVKVPVEDDYVDYLWAQVILPPVLNKKEIVRYPTLFQTYNGPGSQKVTYEWKLNWDHYLSSYHDVIVIAVDGRGTGGRGDAFLHSIYRQLGTLEVDDQLDAAKFFKTNVHYVDPLKMAIMGWSYGGFVASSALGRDLDHELFQCGIAIAPVTDWSYYDSIYTERYMGSPSKEDNYYNYRNSNVSALANNFHDIKFLLIHGTADDNVHYQHSAMLTKSLIEAGVQFRTQVYPDKHHGLVGTQTRKHLYRLVTGFLKDCFGGFDHHRHLHLVLDSLEEIADIEENGGKREDEEEEEPFRSTTSVPTDTPIGF